MAAFWSSEGWRESASLPVGEDLARAVQSGVMFAAPVRRDHDAWVEATRRAVRAVAQEEIADAFIASLTSRRLDLRSALGSYAVARHLPEHSFEAGNASWLCRICGLTRDDEPGDMNVLNFERFKWGGARHDLCYVAFDLEQFLRAPKLAADDAATTLGRQLLEALRRVPPHETASAALKHLVMIKGNVNERASLLDILGVCGVLSTAEHPGYLTTFIPHDERHIPPYRNVERSYPVCWWRGSDGVNEAAVHEYLERLA